MAGMQAPRLKVSVVHDGSMVSMDIDDGRVRIFVSPDGKVVKAPAIG